MDSAYLSAISALLGSIIGGFTSLAASWVTQTTQARTQQRIESKNQRLKLYAAFIDAAAKLHSDALFSNKVEVPNMVGLLTMISHMRMVSSSDVIDKAEKVTRSIVDTYFAPNKTVEEMRAEIDKTGRLDDPLKEFSEACRADLQQMTLQ